MLRHVWVHMIPRLRVGSPDFELWFKQSGIIQARRGDALALLSRAAEKSRTTFGTKTALVVPNHLTGRAVIMRRSFRDPERLRGHIKNGSVRTAACPLTIAAVTVEHYDRVRIDFVANRATRASASYGLGHGEPFMHPRELSND